MPRDLDPLPDGGFSPSDPTVGLPPLVTLEDVAAFFHVTSPTVRIWIRDGRVRTIRTSPTGTGRVLIERAEIARLLVSMRQAPQAEAE